MKLKIVFFLFTGLFLTACQSSDKNKIVGIWINGNDWFDIKQEMKYQTGTGPTVFYKNLDYTIDEPKNELTFYTSTEGKVFYMNYKFIHKDSLRLVNKMPNAQPAIFYRISQLPSHFY